MKKFLAVLLAVAMVMSLIPTMAFADEGQSYLRIEGIAGSSDRTENQLNIIASIAANDVVTIDFRPVGEQTYGSGIFDVRTHDGVTKLFYAQPDDDGWNVHEQSANEGIVAMETVSFVDLGDGWYRASFKVTVAQTEGLHIAFGYNTVEIDNLTVGTKTCSFDEANVVEFEEQNAASLKFDDGTEFAIEQSVNGFDWVASLVEITPPAPSYLHVEALEDYPDRPENQLNVVASIAAGDEVAFDFRPIGDATNDGGIFDVRTHDGARKLFYAKPSSSTPGTWSVNEQVGEAKNNGTVDMETVSFTALNDGWYRVSFEVTVALEEGLHIAFGYYAVEVDNLTIGAKNCSFDEENVVEFRENAASLKFDDGTEFTIERSVNGYDWVASLAPAAEGDTIPAYVGELNSSDVRSGIELTESLATGDVLSFFVKVVPGAEQDLNAIMAGLKLYVRGTIDSDNKAYYIVGGDVTDKQAYGSRLKECAVDCGDGWYYVEVSIPAEDVYFLNLNAEDVSGAKLGEGCMYADICVNGTPITSDVKGYSSKEVLTATQIEVIAIPEPVVMVTPEVTVENATVVIKDAEGNPVEADVEAGAVVTVEVTPAEGYEVVSVTVNGEAYEAGTEITVEDALEIAVVTAEIELDETEDDETEDVEPTGAISAVVVAIAAVIGGAVVLKKREF